MLAFRDDHQERSLHTYIRAYLRISKRNLREGTRDNDGEAFHTNSHR